MSIVVSLVSSQLSVSSSTLWSHCNPAWSFINGHMLNVWFVVCWCPHLPIANFCEARLYRLQDMNLGLSGGNSAETCAISKIELFAGQ